MTDRTRRRAIRALCYQNFDREIFPCVYVVKNHIVFMEYAAKSHYTDYCGKYPIETITYAEAKKNFATSNYKNNEQQQ